MGSNGRMTDDDTRGGIGTITRPAARQGGRQRPPAEVAPPTERRGRRGRPEVPPQRADGGRRSGTDQRTATSPRAGQRTAAPQRTEAPEWPPPAHDAGQPQRTAPGRRADSPQAATQGTPAAAPHRGPFVVLLCGLLGGALISALVISTTLAQGAFQISKLQDSTSALARQKQALLDQVAQAQSAQVIEQRARQLGMRPVGELRFIDPKTGQIRTDAGDRYVQSIHVPGYNP
jgi:hypothetical protein